MDVTYREYCDERDRVDESLGIIRLRDCSVFNKEDSTKAATRMASRILNAVVENTIPLPKNSFWDPSWQQICENELLERILLKSDKCL